MTRPPLQPFDWTSATAKVRAAEDAWNSRDPAKVAAAYTPDTIWRNRIEFLYQHALITTDRPSRADRST